MTPAQYNEYQRQADVIEEEKKRLAELPKKEITDEEIEKESERLYGLADKYSKNRIGFISGAKWYREQLKLKQPKKD